jgi:hypothetical protein
MNTRTNGAVAGAATAAVVLIAVASVARPDEGVPGMVVLMSELLLAGGAAFLLDDAAVALTTVTPLGLWRRRLPRLVSGGILLLVAWLLILAALRWQDSLPAVTLVTGELAVLCLIALAAAGVVSARGEAEPGSQVAPVVGLVGLGALIADLLVETAIFVPWDRSGGLGVRVAWICLGGLAVLILAVSSRDPARPTGHRPTALR